MPNPAIKLTVLLATRNGEQVLPRTLAGYCGVIRPSARWKIVVVDNGSTDSTPGIIASFRPHLPLETLVQPDAGKNRSLNKGLEAAEGEFVVFTDDDAVPDIYFLLRWIEVMEKKPEYGLFGGSIEPLFDPPPPRWLLKSRLDFAFMFAERRLPEGPIEWSEIFGPNMAVRTSLLNVGFRFDQANGPDASDPGYRLGGDSEFCRRIQGSGVHCWFAPAPLVQHIVRPYQFTRDAWARRAYQTGRGRAYLMLRRGPFMPPPPMTWIDWLKALSPAARHRYESSLAYHLARGFRDECARAAAIHLPSL